MNSFYLPPERWREPYRLEGAEAHHLVRVMRTRPGEKLRLFDGHGREGVFLLDRCARDKAHLSLVILHQRPPAMPEVYLALGWNKSSRRAWILEKSVEFGVAGIVFWQADRSQGAVPNSPKHSWHDRCVAAAKQSGNPRLPHVQTLAGGAGELIDRFARCPHRGLLWEKQDAGLLFDPGVFVPASCVVLVLGPEGGLTDEEATLFIGAGFTPWTLGQNTLRWETAALLCLSLLHWQREKYRLDAQSSERHQKT